MTAATRPHGPFGRCSAQARGETGCYCLAGLYGRDGLEPVRLHLARRAAFPSRAANFLRLPTLLWFYDSAGLDPDTALDLLALAGGAAAGAVAAGAASSWALGAAWLAYLSLVNVGQTFLSFQWCGLSAGTRAWRRYAYMVGAPVASAAAAGAATPRHSGMLQACPSSCLFHYVSRVHLPPDLPQRHFCEYCGLVAGVYALRTWLCDGRKGRKCWGACCMPCDMLCSRHAARTIPSALQGGPTAGTGLNGAVAIQKGHCSMLRPLCSRRAAESTSVRQRRDILLLEVGWAALWLAPRSHAAAAREPARAAVVLQRWVLFKLMFCSGAVKIQVLHPLVGMQTLRPRLKLDFNGAQTSADRSRVRLAPAPAQGASAAVASSVRMPAAPASHWEIRV